MSGSRRRGIGLPGRRSTRGSGAAPPAVVPPAAPKGSAVPPSELRNRREALAREFAELQWDLGGLAYEMASRDHFRLDVLTRQAGKLQQVDAELAEVERLLKLDEAGAAGACPSCGALYARGAVFCWQCGTDLMQMTGLPEAAPPNTAAPGAAPELTETPAVPSPAGASTAPPVPPPPVPPPPVPPPAAQPPPAPQPPVAPSPEAQPAVDPIPPTPPPTTPPHWDGQGPPSPVPVAEPPPSPSVAPASDPIEGPVGG